MGEQKIEHFTHIIIGGGIVGAGAFRDLSLHGESVLLLDKGDFNSQTSEASSKMLHGGIRYLENMDFALVKEALFEKNHWLKVAPHLAKEARFYLPIYKESKYPLWMLRAGLFLYDTLSGFQNTFHEVVKKEELLKRLPGLKENGLRGAGVYSDGIVDDSKLGLECIYDGLNNSNSRALNYHEVTSINKDEHYQIEVLDRLTQKKFNFTCEHIIVSVGPFTDQFMKRMEISWNPVMLLSKGSHLWLTKESLGIEYPMVLQTGDGRIIFVIPQRDAILVGTTEVALDDNEDIFDIQASEEEIEYLLENVNNYFPKANVSKEDILSTFAGVRPLVSDGSTDRSKTSRNHKIFNPLENMLVICGGKYTTFRIMAQDVVKMAMESLNKEYDESLSLRPLQTTSLVKSFEEAEFSEQELKDVLEKEVVRTQEDLIKRRLSVISERQLNDEQRKKLDLFVHNQKLK